MKRIGTILIALLAICAFSSCGSEPLLTPIGETSPESNLVSSQTDSSVSSADDSIVTAPESSEPDLSALIGEPVPEGTKQDESYLDDAIFIGDSLTDGLAVYNVLPREQVLANTGINPQTILTKECIEQNGTEKTVVEAASELDPEEIYIMLGANGVAFLNFDDIIGWYSELIDELQTDHPDANIYVQSILPVTRGKELEQENLTNERIRTLNEQIAAMAEEQEVFYLNVAEAIADEDGYLPDELSSDGMHFGVSTYNTWIDYLLCHTVEGALQ
ncbi:MAG: GDSL-type esterase/lipase family protein [Candidatus Merdivicinus sp.]|jgi:hypothetical protein